MWFLAGETLGLFDFFGAGDLDLREAGDFDFFGAGEFLDFFGVGDFDFFLSFFGVTDLFSSLKGVSFLAYFLADAGGPSSSFGGET